MLITTKTTKPTPENIRGNEVIENKHLRIENSKIIRLFNPINYFKILNIRSTHLPSNFRNFSTATFPFSMILFLIDPFS